MSYFINHNKEYKYTLATTRSQESTNHSSNTAKAKATQNKTNQNYQQAL